MCLDDLKAEMITSSETEPEPEDSSLVKQEVEGEVDIKWETNTDNSP